MGAAPRHRAALFAALGLLAAVPLLYLGASALQRRPALGPSAEAALPPSDLNLSAGGACLGSDLGLLIQGRAPACLRACPSLCPQAIPAIAEALENGRARRALCAHRAALACANGPLGAEACAPVLALAPHTMLAAGSPSELEALCSGPDGVGAAHSQQGGQAAEFLAGALARRGGAGQDWVPLERSLGTKEEYPLCEGAPEGWNCVPGNDSGPSVSMVYCTAKKYKLQGPKLCSLSAGADSHCVMNGPTGSLNVAQCDDPFCRNGGADHGNGLYCDKEQVVNCTGVGDNAPVVVDACSDTRIYFSQDCYRVQERHCEQSSDGVRCEDGGSYLDGSGCYARRD